MTPETCEQCGHPFGPHAVVATSGNPIDGGIMLCPVPDCRCFSTWDTNAPGAKKKEDVFVPAPAEIEALRTLLWAGEL